MQIQQLQALALLALSSVTALPIHNTERDDAQATEHPWSVSDLLDCYPAGQTWDLMSRNYRYEAVGIGCDALTGFYEPDESKKDVHNIRDWTTHLHMSIKNVSKKTLHLSKEACREFLVPIIDGCQRGGRTFAGDDLQWKVRADPDYLHEVKGPGASPSEWN